MEHSNGYILISIDLEWLSPIMTTAKSLLLELWIEGRARVETVKPWHFSNGKLFGKICLISLVIFSDVNEKAFYAYVDLRA